MIWSTNGNRISWKKLYTKQNDKNKENNKKVESRFVSNQDSKHKLQPIDVDNTVALLHTEQLSADRDATQITVFRLLKSYRNWR